MKRRGTTGTTSWGTTPTRTRSWWINTPLRGVLLAVCDSRSARLDAVPVMLANPLPFFPPSRSQSPSILFTLRSPRKPRSASPRKTSYSGAAAVGLSSRSSPSSFLSRRGALLRRDVVIIKLLFFSPTFRPLRPYIFLSRERRFITIGIEKFCGTIFVFIEFAKKRCRSERETFGASRYRSIDVRFS